MTKPRYDTESIRLLFDDMAVTYGRVNLISSFGFTVRWRNQVVDGLPLASAECVVDLMSGMGELWRSLARSLPASARVVGVDISPEMTRRASRQWHFPVEICVVDVLAWDRAATADIVVSSFGLKTFSQEQQQQLADKVACLLKPGGAKSSAREPENTTNGFSGRDGTTAVPSRTRGGSAKSTQSSLRSMRLVLAGTSSSSRAARVCGRSGSPLTPAS